MGPSKTIKHALFEKTKKYIDIENLQPDENVDSKNWEWNCEKGDAQKYLENKKKEFLKITSASSKKDSSKVLSSIGTAKQTLASKAFAKKTTAKDLKIPSKDSSKKDSNNVNNGKGFNLLGCSVR